MLGALIIVVVLVVAIPVGVIMSGAVMAAILGFLGKETAEAEGDETWRKLNY